MSNISDRKTYKKTVTLKIYSHFCETFQRLVKSSNATQSELVAKLNSVFPDINYAGFSDSKLNEWTSWNKEKSVSNPSSKYTITFPQLIAISRVFCVDIGSLILPDASYSYSGVYHAFTTLASYFNIGFAPVFIKKDKIEYPEIDEDMLYSNKSVHPVPMDNEDLFIGIIFTDSELSYFMNRYWSIRSDYAKAEKALQRLNNSYLLEAFYNTSHSWENTALSELTQNTRFDLNLNEISAKTFQTFINHALNFDINHMLRKYPIKQKTLANELCYSEGLLTQKANGLTGLTAYDLYHIHHYTGRFLEDYLFGNLNKTACYSYFASLFYMFEHEHGLLSEESAIIDRAVINSYDGLHFIATKEKGRRIHTNIPDNSGILIVLMNEAMQGFIHELYHHLPEGHCTTKVFSNLSKYKAFQSFITEELANYNTNFNNELNIGYILPDSHSLFRLQ